MPGTRPPRRGPRPRPACRTPRTRPLLAADTYPQLHRSGAEFELLAQSPLDVADVGLGQTPVGEEGEGRRVDGPLHDVADTGPRRRLAQLDLLQGAVEGTRRHALVIGLDRIAKGRENPVHALARLG